MTLTGTTMNMNKNKKAAGPKQLFEYFFAKKFFCSENNLYLCNRLVF